MTTLNLYNTESRSLESFEPADPENVLMYVCGPTVYDSPHLGHARAAVVFDVLYRALQQQYGNEHVTYVRNFTDVDDKIIAKAEELGLGISEVSSRYIEEYLNAVTALGCLSPTKQPRVTEVMEDIIAFIEGLISNGSAYEADGAVFFDVRSFADYGKLSNRSTDELETVHRVEVDPRKKNPLDFALWKEAKPDEPTWDSPWGPGRPGWHIECSVMATKFVAPTLDIHGGGQDLIFPHHENEIAQCEALHSVPFVRYWVHNGFVRVKTEKMSKSLRNFVTVGELLDRWPAEALRYFLISSHYRTPLDYSEHALAEATKALFRLHEGFQRLASLPAAGDPPSKKQVAKVQRLQDRLTAAKTEFLTAICDDLNTALALGKIFEAVRELNDVLRSFPSGLADEYRSPLQKAGADLQGVVASLSGITATPTEVLHATWRRKALDVLKLNETEIEKTVQARARAREARSWEKADQLRDELARQGVIVEDTLDGSHWYIDPDVVAAKF